MRYLSDQQFYFVHIPKNGGQSVRNAMARAGTLSFAPLAQDMGVDNDAAAALSEEGFDHPSLGKIHPAHLPLWALQDAFAASWAAFEQSTSLALTREPRARFMSALMQRLKEFRGAGAIRADDPQVAQEAAAVCEWLAARDRHADLDYVHFIRQVDFTDIDGTRRVDGVFPMARADIAAQWLGARTGLVLDITHDHARRQPKPWARAIQPVARFAGRNLMPRGLKRAMHPLWMKSGVFSDAAKGYDAVELGTDVEAFIKEYYAADAALHVSAQQAAAALEPAQ
ncbi:MAG: hypothetical protein ABJN72_06375 [Sulfitobacter sp.]